MGWAFLPFMGGGKGGNGEKEAIRQTKANAKMSRRPSQVDAGLSRHQTLAQQFAAKEEEDIVRDYNSPVHMWVSLTSSPKPKLPHILTSTGRNNPLSPHSRHLRPHGLHVQHLRHRHPLARHCAPPPAKNPKATTSQTPPGSSPSTSSPSSSQSWPTSPSSAK